MTNLIQSWQLDQILTCKFKNSKLIQIFYRAIEIENYSKSSWR